jgi:hypothetical protein
VQIPAFTSYTFFQFSKAHNYNEPKE